MVVLALDSAVAGGTRNVGCESRPDDEDDEDAIQWNGSSHLPRYCSVVLESVRVLRDPFSACRLPNHKSLGKAIKPFRLSKSSSLLQPHTNLAPQRSLLLN